MKKEHTVAKGIEQGRAAFAYEAVEKAIEILGGPTDKKSREYKAYAKKIPMLIKNNGLGATFAFIKSKAKAKEDKPGLPCKLLYEQTDKWLKQYDAQIFNQGKDLEKTIISISSAEYRAVTIEVLALFNWLRRFVEGLIEGEAEDEN